MTRSGTASSAGTVGALDTTFLASVTAPVQVRTLVELRLASWGLGRLRDDMTLIASELVTNAVRWGDEREIRVRLAREPGAVLLAVWDPSDGKPAPKRALDAAAGDMVADGEALNPGHDAGTGGRGLPIVEALSSACGVIETAPAGKWVWARMAV